MERFPNEILLNIFQHLSIYSQHQCLQVCRSWNAVALSFTTGTQHKMTLNGYFGIRILLREVIANPARGLAIRRIHFFTGSFGTGEPLTQPQFIWFLNKFPHLAEISLNDTHPIYHHEYLCGHNIRLPQLEVIHLRLSAPHHKRDHKYMNLIYKYRATINQMCINVTGLDISRLRLNSITDYLRQFPCLKYLSLETLCPTEFDAIIQACPQLQVFRLRMRPYSGFKVMADERNSIMPALTPASQLETLKINDALISRQLYQYLKRCCTFLSHLVINMSSDSYVDLLISTFDAFEDAQALSITRISFEKYTPKVNILMQNLGRWFPHLNQVDIKEFRSTPVRRLSEFAFGF